MNPQAIIVLFRDVVCWLTWLYMVISSEKFVFSISANTNFFIYEFIPSSLVYTLTLFWTFIIYVLFFIIAEMALTMPCSFYMLQKYSSNVFKTCFYFSFPIFYMDVYQQLFLNISGWSYFLNSKFAICTYFAWLNSCMFTDLIWHTQSVTWLYFFFIRHVYCFFMSQVLVF